MSREELLLEVAELDILVRLDRKADWIMAEIDNLQAAVADAADRLTALEAAAKAIEDKLAATTAPPPPPAGVDPALVQAAAEQQVATNNATQAVIDGLNAAAQ